MSLFSKRHLKGDVSEQWNWRLEQFYGEFKGGGGERNVLSQAEFVKFIYRHRAKKDGSAIDDFGVK